MSQLSPFVRALRALAGSLMAEAHGSQSEGGRFHGETEDEARVGRYTLNRIAAGLNGTATDLEQQIARDLARTGPLSEEVEREHNGGYTVTESDVTSGASE